MTKQQLLERAERVRLFVDAEARAVGHEPHREVGEAWAAEAIAMELVMDLANALYEEHGGPRVSEGLHGPCVVCKLIERAREWAK